jgi:hypothetical protein
MNEALRNAREALRTRSPKLYRIYSMNAKGYFTQTNPRLLERILEKIKETIRNSEKEEEKKEETPENAPI